MNKDKYLLEELAKNIKWFRDESKTHKSLYRTLRYIVFGLTACSTALAGIALAFPLLQMPINVAIILTTTIVGVVTSIEGLRKPSELWIHERTIYYSLRDLERDLQYRSAGLSDSEAAEVADDVFERMQDVLGSARDRWSRQIAGRSTGESSHGQMQGAR